MSIQKSGRKRQWVGYFAVVGLLHLVGILLLLMTTRQHPALLGIGALAYSLGLRHAFDADHIAAIDNTVRKLVQQKESPHGVGLFFSLGHSTVVCLLSVLMAFAVRWVQREMPELQGIGGMIGTVVSGLFLLIIGGMNLFLLVGMYRGFVNLRQGKQQRGQSQGQGQGQIHSQIHSHMEEQLLHGGLLYRFIAPLFKWITKSWHVYPVGFLFGLGFDTASEIALLAISAGAVQESVPVTGILALPVLFAAGMSLLDTADGLFMTTAYQWAFATPLRKLYYNLAVTGLAVVAALLIGFVELAQVFATTFGWQAAFWQWVQTLDFSSLGYLLVGLFGVTWAIAVGAWKLLRIEKRWSA